MTALWLALGYSDHMVDESEAGKEPEHAGLCADCLHARRVLSDRGSVFLYCELSRSDQQFPKYPRLPVLSCPGYERRAHPASTA